MKIGSLIQIKAPERLIHIFYPIYQGIYPPSLLDGDLLFYVSPATQTRVDYETYFYPKIGKLVELNIRWHETLSKWIIAS